MALAVCLCLWKFPSATGCFRGHLKPWLPDWWEQIRWDEVEGDAVRAGTPEQVRILSPRFRKSAALQWDLGVNTTT